MIKYGLRHKPTGNLLGCFFTSNEGSDFCNDTTCRLTTSGGLEWLKDDPQEVEYVRNFSTEWYNSCYDSPNHEFNKDDLEVVEVNVSYTPIEVRIPSVEEYLKLRYNTKGNKYYNPEHYEYILSELKEHPNDLRYSLYDLGELKREGII